MLNKIIHFSLHNRLIVLGAALLLMIIGIYSASKMEVDVFPDLNAPTVVVMTEAMGMAPEEVEHLVTFPIETALNGASNVRRVRSSSTTGFSVVWIEFDWDTEIYKARQIVSEKLASIQDLLPSHIGTPTLGPQSSILGEIMIIGLSSQTTDLQELRTLADRTIRPRLLSMGGVAQVSVIGGDIKEYQICLHPDRMKHFGITLDEVSQVVSGMNQNTSGGILYDHDNEYIIRGLLSTSHLSELGQAVIKTNDHTPIVLEDIATIQIGNKSPQLGLASNEATPAVLITVTKQPSSSTIDLSQRLDRTIDDIRHSLPSDIHISTDLFRQERFINSSIDNIQKSLYEGAIFVVIVLFLFLMNVRTTFISLLTIPLALLCSILAMQGMGITINTMTLGGMAIAIGSLVDDAIVDVENVFKRLRENRLLPPESQKSTLSVIFDASKEVRMPILYSTLIIIAGFAPLFFLSGMEGKMLVPLGVAFIVALCASTLVALTLTPVLCSYLLKSESSLASSSDKEPILTRKAKGLYRQALTWAIDHKRWVLGSTGIALVAAIVVFAGLGRSFLPEFNEGALTINVSTMPGISLEESDRIGQMCEEILLTIPEIQTTGRKTGRAELDEHAQGVNSSEIEAPFILDKRSKEDMLQEIRDKLGVLSGLNIEIGQPISHRIDAMLSGTRANVAIKLFGTDLDRMFRLGNRIKSTIQDIPGIVDLNVEQQVERPQLQIRPRRELLAKHGITLPDFGRVVSTLLSGEVVSQVYEGRQAYDLTLKVEDSHRSSIERIKDLLIDADGYKIPLSDVSEVTSSTGPNTINRENVMRKVIISANISGRDLRSVVEDIQQTISEQISLPEGYHIEYGGQFESEQAASRTLLVTSLISILVIFLLVYAQFKDGRQALVVILNLPLALIGGVFAIALSGGILSIPGIIGFISLFGIATRNGMLLISKYNDLRHEGHAPLDCVMIGSLDRLTPILMTALTSGLALIPLAISGDLPGNEIQSPLAKVILGGLLTSTCLNGFIIPIMYLLTTPKSHFPNQ